MEFKQPDLFMEPESKSVENQDTQLIQHDEDTMASLDLFIETLETDAQEGRMLVPPSPFHSDSNFDIYSGLDDNAVSASEHLSKSCRADYRNQYLNPPGAQGSPQCSQRSQDCHFASPNKDLEFSNKEQEQCLGEQNSTGLSPKGPDTKSPDREQVQNLQMAVNLGQGKASTREDFQTLMDKYTTLRANMLSLCYTAQREMQRKMAQINELREEIASHVSNAGVRKSQSEVSSQTSLVSTKDQLTVNTVVHSHVQTEPSVLPLCKDDSVQTVTVGTASISIQTVTASVNATMNTQTEAVKFSERLVQTDSTSVSSSSSQTAPCPLKSAGMQTGPDLPVSVKEVASQSCPAQGDSKSVQTEHAENSHEKSSIDLVSQVTEQEVTLSCSTLMDSKSVQAVFSNGNKKLDSKERAVVLKPTEEVSAQRSFSVMVSECSLTNSKEIQQGQGSSEQQSHTTVCDPDTSVKCTLETDSAASMGVLAKVPDSGFAQAGSLLRSHSTDVPSSAVEQISTGEKKRRHSSSPMSGPHGDCKRGRYSLATGQLSRIRSADSSNTFHTSTPMHEYRTSKNLEKSSSKELSVSFQTACSVTPGDNFSADFVLSDDDEEEEGEDESVGKSNRDVSSSELFVTASMHSGDSRSSDVNDLQLVSEIDTNPGMDEIEKESALCHDSNEYASLPPVIESPSDDNVFVESCMFKKPIPSQVVGENSSKASLAQFGSGDASPSLQSERSHPVSGPFKHVQGQEWKRKLFLWATYAHRRVSRKQEIDKIYYGHQRPKTFDWRNPDQCQESDGMCDQTVNSEFAVSDMDKNYGGFEQDSEQMSCHSGHALKPDIEQEVNESDSRADLQNSDQKTVDRNENSDASSISGEPYCSVSFDSTLSDAKSTESKSSAHKKKAKRKKKKKDKTSTEKRMEKREKKKQKKRDGGDSLRAEGLAFDHRQQYDQEGNSQKQFEQSQGTYPDAVLTQSEPSSTFPPAVTICREAEVKQVVSATGTRTSGCGGMLSPHLNFEQAENCSLNAVPNQKSTLTSVEEEQRGGIEGLDSGGTLHNEEAAAAEETSLDQDVIDASSSDEGGSEMLFDAGNKAAALNSPVNDAAADDSDFSIHTDDTDTEDNYSQPVVLQTKSAQNISIPQAYGTHSSGSETTNSSDGQCSESDEAMDISVGRDEQRSLPGCEAALSSDVSDSAQVHVRSGDSEVPTMPFQPSLTPDVASDFSATAIKMPDILQEKTDGDQRVEITAAVKKQPCVTDEAFSEFPSHHAIPFSSVHPPATPEKLPFVNSKESEVRTPDAKLVSSLRVSKGSPIWSPEKSSFTLLNSDSMDTHLYNKLLGDTSSSLSNPSPSKESVTGCSASQAQKTALLVTHITPVAQKGREISGQLKTLSCGEKNSGNVTEESKVGESGKSRKQDLVNEEGPTKLPVDDKTPLFGYPSFTTLLKGGTKLSFQYKRRPDYLAPSSSSSASSVTASSSSSATSTSSSSSLPTDPSNQRPSSTVRSAEKLEVLEECSVEDTDSKGFSVGSESNGTNTSTASAERKGRPIFIQENSNKEREKMEQMKHAEGFSNAVKSSKAKKQRPAASNRSNLTESYVKSNGDACSLSQGYGSRICAATKVGDMSADLKKVEKISGSGNGSTTVISTAVASFKPAVEKELEEGEVESSGSFVRLCDRGGDYLQPMPDVSEPFERSLEEGEIRTADGTTEDDEHIDSSESVKSPQPIDSENAQFRDIRDLFQVKQQHAKASFPAAANTASKCSLDQNSGLKSEENFEDSRKRSAVSTVDKTSLAANVDLKAQKCRESRDQMERVRRQIFGQQASCGDSEMHSNADGPAAKSYKIPKLDKNTRDIRRRGVAEEHNKGRRKAACPPGRSTRAPRCKSRIPVSHSSDTPSWKYGTHTGPTSRSPNRTSASKSLQHDGHAAATYKSSKHAHSVSTLRSPEQLCTSRSSHHSSAVSSITEVDHVATSKESNTYNEQGTEKSASSERVDVRDCGQKSGSVEVEGTDGFMLESDSDRSSSGSLTDPDLDGSCRTRSFIYYRNPYKDRPELEMSLDEDEDSDEDGQNSDQEDDNPKNQKECDNVNQDGSEDGDEDDQWQGNCNEDAQEDCESDKREDTHGQGGVADEEDPTQHLSYRAQNDDINGETSYNISGQEQASKKNDVPSAGLDGRDLGLTRKEPSKPRASAEVNAFKEHKIKTANRTETDAYRCDQVGQENNRNHTEGPVPKGRVVHSPHEYQNNKEKEHNTVEKDNHLGKDLCCKVDGESEISEEENNSVAGSGDSHQVSELFSADGGGTCLGDKATGSLSDGEIPDSSDECDDDKESHKSAQEESTGIPLSQMGDTHVSKDALIDCLSLDAFCNSEGHFLLEQSDMSANEDDVGPSKQNTKRESQSGLSSSSVKLGKASTNVSMNTTSTASCTERTVSSQQCRSGDSNSNNKSWSSTVTSSRADGKNVASRDRYLQSTKHSTKGSKGSSGSPTENDRHYQAKNRLVKQSRFPSRDFRQKCGSRSLSKENGRPVAGRCSSTEEHSDSQERCCPHSQPGSFSCLGHPRRVDDRDHRFHRESSRKRKMSSTCSSSSCSCEHRQTSSRNRMPSPNSERGQAWHRKSWHDERHSDPSSKCYPPASRRHRGYGEHRQARLRLPHHPPPRGHVRNCTRSRGPAAREECSCVDCLVAHSRSCHCQSCSDGRRSGSPSRCNATCGGPPDARCKRRRDDSHSGKRRGQF